MTEASKNITVAGDLWEASKILNVVEQLQEVRGINASGVSPELLALVTSGMVRLSKVKDARDEHSTALANLEGLTDEGVTDAVFVGSDRNSDVDWYGHEWIEGGLDAGLAVHYLEFAAGKGQEDLSGADSGILKRLHIVSDVAQIIKLSGVEA